MGAQLGFTLFSLEEVNCKNVNPLNCCLLPQVEESDSLEQIRPEIVIDGQTVFKLAHYFFILIQCKPISD